MFSPEIFVSKHQSFQESWTTQYSLRTLQDENEKGAGQVHCLLYIIESQERTLMHDFEI